MAPKSYSINRYHVLLALLTLGQALNAAPRLKLDQTVFTASIAQGSNGPTETANAKNIGDGSLNLQASSSVTWLSPTVGSPASCSITGPCTPIQIALNTSSLANGTYTGLVTVADPNAIDAPQFVTVTVEIGGDVPNNLEYFLPPGGSATTNFITASQVGTTVSPNTPWLAIAVNGEGSFTFNVPYQVKVTTSSSMAVMDYNGSITLTGSSFAPDNKTIPVLLHVTTNPIVQISPSSLQFQIAQGAVKQTANVAVSNAGQGSLNVDAVTVSTANGQTWLSAQLITGGVSVTADPTGLSPGVYQGSFFVGSNAANSPTIPVQLTVEASGPPITYTGGVVNNGNFAGGLALAQGDIVALFGDQLSYMNPQPASSLPLPQTLGTTQVLVNGVPAPLYYVAPGQINLEIPIDATTGNGTIQVVRDGQNGNMAYVNIQGRQSNFILLHGGPYVIMTTPAPESALTGIPSHPVHAGDVVQLYVIGLGPTTPLVASGTASPSSPLAKITDTTQVCFGAISPFAQPICVNPSFTGLTPGLVGLYQINFKVPAGLGSGNLPFYFTVGGASSDQETIATQ